MSSLEGWQTSEKVDSLTGRVGSHRDKRAVELAGKQAVLCGRLAGRQIGEGAGSRNDLAPSPPRPRPVPAPAWSRRASERVNNRIKEL
ncbi:hypothetical protein E2C01_083597 [Portunus trituberculatus]|uniref:Uncharacterized protein n=1 Tax=Portunus trituberculatus TaxID=210409 RepID=A0A5B7J6Z4_PORTR|nr:hypothetical protein [Portunus trituberculatus]